MSSLHQAEASLGVTESSRNPSIRRSSPISFPPTSLSFIQAELERSFDFGQLCELSRWVGLDPAILSPNRSTPSLAPALLVRATELGAVEALCDAIARARDTTDPRVEAIRRAGFRQPEAVAVGGTLGPYRIEAELGVGEVGTVFLATEGERRVRLKVLSREAARDPVNVERALARARAGSTKTLAGSERVVFAGELDGRVAIASEYVAGRTLAERDVGPGPERLRRIWPTLRAVLDALALLHSHRLVHGSLCPENVLEGEGQGQLRLLDAGGHFLRRAIRGPSPEQILGEPPTARSDLYAFGALFYELITGRPPFTGTREEIARGHLATQVDPPSFARLGAPLEPEIDELLLDLLDKKPELRPDAESTRDRLSVLVARVAPEDNRLPAGAADDLVGALLANPGDEERAAVLESSIARGNDPRRVAEAFMFAAEQLDTTSSGWNRLVSRAAGLYELLADDPVAAENVYRRRVAARPDDEAAWAGLERISRRRGGQEKLVELLLERAMSEQLAPERARVLTRLGRVLCSELNDPAQALVAYTQAFSEDPTRVELPPEIEGLIAAGHGTWDEVFTVLVPVVQAGGADGRRHPILLQMGRWYATYAVRLDLAQACFAEILRTDATNDGALAELAEVYRQTMQWADLCAVLLQRARGPIASNLARDLRIEAANLRARPLKDTLGAIALYEELVADEPGSEVLNEALAKLYSERGSWGDVARTLERLAESSYGVQRRERLVHLAQVVDEREDDAERAISVYRRVLGETPGHLPAIAGLERIYTRTGRPLELRTLLEEELQWAESPRQRVVLLTKLADITAREFLDVEGATVILERALELDPTSSELLTRLCPLYEQLGHWEQLAGALSRRADALPRGAARVARLMELAHVLEDRLERTDPAMMAYEEVLLMDPNHEGALDGVARTGAVRGDLPRAARALDVLAEGAASGATRAKGHLRAGALLEKHGDLRGAIARYERATEAMPEDGKAAAMLRAAHVACGDYEIVVTMLERDLARAETPSLRVSFGLELARLFVDHLRDPGRAEAALERVFAVDPDSAEAQRLAGDIAHAAGRFAEAVKCYAVAARHAQGLPASVQVAMLARYADAQARAGTPAAGLVEAERLVTQHPGERAAWHCAASLAFEHGTPERAATLNRQLLDRFGEAMDDRARASVLYRLGESLRRADQLDEALPLLEKAADLDVTAPEPMRSLRAAYEKKQAWPEVIKVRLRQLERAPASDRGDLWIELGDFASSTLKDPSTAASAYLRALGERPTDRRIPLKLMRLYADERNWTDLLLMIERSAEGAADTEQRARHLLLAARVTLTELQDRAGASALVDRALSGGASSEPVIREAITLKNELGDAEGLRALLELQIDAAVRGSDGDRAVALSTLLADLHLSELHTDEAITLNEAILRISGNDPAREAILAELYASDPARYVDRALALAERVLGRDPHHPEPYRMLRDLHTRSGDVDGAWCACQALHVLGQSSAEEEILFAKHRALGELPPEACITEDDWKSLLVHPDAAPRLTAIYARIQPAVIASRGLTLQAAGFTDRHVLVPNGSREGVVGPLIDVARLLRMQLPMLVRDETGGGLSFVPTRERCLSVGAAALRGGIPIQAASYAAGAHLAYFRPGFHVRALVRTAMAMKAWLLAAIRTIAPRVIVAAELEGAVNEAQRQIDAHVTGRSRDWLAQLVTDLLQEDAQVDVVRWMNGVDLTADRVALVACGDLPTVLAAFRAIADADGAVPTSERARQLLAYSVSGQYLSLRSRLGIGVARE